MKRLYLIRHAKSSWNNADLADYERPLNKRGEKDTPFMGKRLKKHDVKPDLIISSPAKRALKTAKIIAQEIGYPTKKIYTNESIYDAAPLSLLNTIRNIDDLYDQVMLFGHNSITELARYFTKYQVENVPTCGIFCIGFDLDSWEAVSEGKGDFIFFDYPKKHQKSS